MARAVADVQVVLEADWTLHVISRGASIAGVDLDTLKRRFTRGEMPGVGAGLGLAMADQVMRASGGALHLHSPAPEADDGFEVVMQLP